MSIPAAAISLTVILNGEEHHLETYTDAYRNLMAFLYDKLDMEEFGECKGVGRCGTCRVKILNRPDLTGQFEGNEETTLIKSGVTDPDIRLSCKLLLNESINGLKINIEVS